MESWPGGRKAGRHRVMTEKAQGGQNRRQVGDDSIKKEEKWGLWTIDLASSQEQQQS